MIFWCYYLVFYYFRLLADFNNKSRVALIPSLSFNLSPSYSTPIKPVSSASFTICNIFTKSIVVSLPASSKSYDLALTAIAADIIITSASIPGKEPPKLISKETIHQMKEGSIIVDLAAGLAMDGSGNCPLSEDNKIINVGGVTIIGLNNLPSLLSTDASALYSRNIFEFIKEEL